MTSKDDLDTARKERQEFEKWLSENEDDPMLYETDPDGPSFATWKAQQKRKASRNGTNR